MKENLEFLEEMKVTIVTGIAKCIADLDVYVDLAEQYEILPAENIKIFREKMKNPFRE